MTIYKRNPPKKSKEIYDYILGWAKKIKAIHFLGEKCECCGEDNMFKLCFHHIIQEDKEYNINYLINKRWSIIQKELEKCQLLCQNCHRELHDNLISKESIDYKRRFNNKKLLLEYKNQFSCQKCGYNKNIKSLDFHHREKSTKLFRLSKVVANSRITNINDIDLSVKNELDKCDVLCANCHGEEHLDLKKFETYKESIYLKSESITENKQPLDREEIKRMYESGMKQSEIVKFFNTSKGCISEIIHKLGYGKSMPDIQINENEFVTLHNEGKTRNEIKDILKCSKFTLWRLYKKFNIIPNKMVKTIKGRIVSIKNNIIQDIDFILECKTKNMSYREMGKLLNISYVAVRQRYEKYKSSIKLSANIA